MKYNYLLSSYNHTMMKYKKYFSRLQRDINNGSFVKLSVARKNFLLRKVEELRTKLASMQPKLAGIAAVTGLLLALNAPQTQAQIQFISKPAKNPLGEGIILQNSYSWTQPGMADLDNDGDKDMFVANGHDHNFYYYKNTGTNSTPSYTLQTGTNNPLNGVSDFNYNAPQFVDLDGDGDLDIVNTGLINAATLQLSYYINTGTVSSPVFVAQTGTDNPFPVLYDYTGYTSACPVDIDGDGDKDIFIIDAKYGDVYFFENTGTATDPMFSLNTSSNPFPTGDVTSIGADTYLFATFADIDGDGDQDALLGQRYNEILLYKNTGTATAPVLSLQSGTNNPFTGFTLRWQAPSLVDLNNDGKIDLVIGGENNTSVFYNAGTISSPVFKGFDVGGYSKPVFADIDGDGDKDLIVGEYAGLFYFMNTGTTSAPVFVKATGTNNPFATAAGYGRQIAPALSDIDGDGDLDLLTGNRSGTFNYFMNTGTSTAPVYTLSSGSSFPMFGVTIGNNSTPVFVDLDNDGDKDLVIGEYSDLFYFMNTGTASAPVYTAQTGTDNPVAVTVSSTSLTPTFVNFDGDSDLDLVVGTSSGVLYFVNTGTASAPVFTAQTGTNNPFAISSNEQKYAPAFLDIEVDGDLDLFTGNQDGTLNFYENTILVISTAIEAPLSASFNGELSAYPNPVKDVLSFSLNDAIGSKMQVSVLNMAGSEMMTQNFENSGATININVSGLNAGIYVLKLSSDAKAGVVKFVKQ